jgi:hypothetical protein
VWQANTEVQSSCSKCWQNSRNHRVRRPQFLTSSSPPVQGCCNSPGQSKTLEGREGHQGYFRDRRHLPENIINRKMELVILLSNGNSTANLSSASFANVASTRASTRGRVFGAFRVDVVTRQSRRHSPSRVTRTRQTRRHSPSRVSRTRQTRRHLPSRVARTRQTRERRVWQVLCKFSECRLDCFIHIKYVICA